MFSQLTLGEKKYNEYLDTEKDSKVEQIDLDKIVEQSKEKETYIHL